MLLRRRADYYRSTPPAPEDVLLLIEVADSSVGYDRNEKLPRYAHAGVPEVWLTILPERVIEAHTEPAGGRYTQMRTFRPGDTISPACFPISPCRWTRSCPDNNRTYTGGSAMVTQTRLRAKSETGPGAGGQPQPRLFTIDEYFAMAKAGILGSEERVELIDGVVITMPPIGNLHNASVDKSNRNLVISVWNSGHCAHAGVDSAERPLHAAAGPGSAAGAG